MRPQFSVVSAIYNVAEYIEEYLVSLERQTYGIENLEVILVDDGSTDGAGEIAKRWAQGTTARVHFLRQDNAGQGAARNAGLEVATGEWVTFADPDDVLADSYFAEVAAFLAAQSRRPDMLATRLLTFTDDPKRHVNRHALRDNFKNRNQTVDLSRFPDRIHLSGGSAFLQLDRLRRAGIRFDTRIRPSFEDGHLVGVYLLQSPAPHVGFIRTAEYYYRKRVDGSSSVQSGWARAERYTDVPRYGFLDLLTRAVQSYGSAPAWLQNTVLYDLLWYFKADTQIVSATGAIPVEALEEFHALCAEIFTHIDVETIMGFRIVRTEHWLRLALVAGYKKPQMRPECVFLDQLDNRQKLLRVRYMYSGECPSESFFSRGLRVDPLHAKVRQVQLLGRSVAFERLVWLPAEGTLRITLDGRPIPMSVHGPVDLPYSMTTEQLWKGLGYRRPSSSSTERRGRRAYVKGLILGPPQRVSRKVRSFGSRSRSDQRIARTVKWLAKTGFAQRRFGDAWVLMDRLEQAQDNAEHLYRYLSAEQPQVNAWFVLDRKSADWSRLAREGFKLVPYGSVEWRVLLLLARHVVSSHANAYVLTPLPRRLYGPPQWRFTFLQHGVGKDDYSRWLNPKRLHMIVTTTEAEERSFSGDQTPYVFTTKEVQRTGLPRHDALLKRAGQLSPREVDRILVMPTWRRSISEGIPEGWTSEQRRQRFLESDYAQRWLGLLQSAEVHELAVATGSRLSLLPHPNMAPFLDRGDLPDHVDLLDWAAIDVQDVFARTRLLVTDYSSVAFEVALLGRSTVYYHFDREEFFSGAQPFRKGYFDYERDGFGPVATSYENLLVELKRLAANGFVPDEDVAARMQATFNERDGRSCQRVYAAITQLDRRVGPRLLAAPGETLPVLATQEPQAAMVPACAQVDAVESEVALAATSSLELGGEAAVRDGSVEDRSPLEALQG